MKEHLRSYFPDRFEPTSKSRLYKLLDANTPSVRYAKCQFQLSKLYRENEGVKLMAGAMRAQGCNFDLARHVSCERCYGTAGGYDPDTNQIVLCSNTFINEHKYLSVLMHEMIHMYDYCRAKMDFNNINHVACSEIRAANLTHCSIYDGIKFGQVLPWEYKGAHAKCVKRVAASSVQAFDPNMTKQEVDAVIDRIFPLCYNDLEPLGRRPIMNKASLRHSYQEGRYFGYT